MNVIQEIARMQLSGYSLGDTYIYLKDYISIEQLTELWETQ